MHPGGVSAIDPPKLAEELAVQPLGKRGYAGADWMQAGESDCQVGSVGGISRRCGSITGCLTRFRLPYK